MLTAKRVFAAKTRSAFAFSKQAAVGNASLRPVGRDSNLAAFA
jgi:hypothetical protein